LFFFFFHKTKLYKYFQKKKISQKQNLNMFFLNNHGKNQQ
jgi:hypothetical protein